MERSSSNEDMNLRIWYKTKLWESKILQSTLNAKVYSWTNTRLQRGLAVNLSKLENMPGRKIAPCCNNRRGSHLGNRLFPMHFCVCPCMVQTCYVEQLTMLGYPNMLMVLFHTPWLTNGQLISTCAMSTLWVDMWGIVTESSLWVNMWGIVPVFIVLLEENL